MLEKMGEAVRLLLNNFRLISLIVLTVWLPGNLLLAYVTHFGSGPDSPTSAMRGAMYIEVIFGPIYVGALVFALWKIKQGQTVRYREAIHVGIKNWGRLFGARLVANLQITLGLIAFIIPGIVLALQYALLDSAVIIEGMTPSRSRQRSTELTKGIKLQIFATVALFYVLFMLAGGMLYFPLYFAAELGQLGLPHIFALEVAADCVLDIVNVLLTIAIFLFYWEKRHVELPAYELDQVVADSEEDVANALEQLAHVDDNDNPYRSPQM